MTNSMNGLEATLLRIAEALERLSPPPAAPVDFSEAAAFIWQAEENNFLAVPHVNRTPIALLKSVERMRDTLLANTESFASGLPANNALLWGARGMGKSSLVKAVHASVNQHDDVAGNLKLIEIHREDIESLPTLMTLLRGAEERVIVFCDDLSFDGND